MTSLPSSARDAFLAAFEALGGVDALAAWANENPTPFYTLLIKLAPEQADAGAGFAEVSETPLSEGEWRARANALA